MTPAGDALVARLDVLAWRLDRGECPAREEMEALAEEATRLGPTLDLDGRCRLSGAVARVSAALERSGARIAGRIRTIAVGRRAARAYGGATDATADEGAR